jgi:hypothetical protein
MKRTLILLASWALRTALYASRQLWADLRRNIRNADSARDLDGKAFSDAAKHAAVDEWLSGQAGFAEFPEARKRLIQAAVLSIRLEAYFQ